MKRRDFTRCWLLALLGLFLAIVLLPLLMAPVLLVSKCGDACGALMVVLGIFLRIPMIVGVGIFLGVLAWKRSRSLGILPWGFLFVLISYLAASPFFFTIGGFWHHFVVGFGSTYVLLLFGFLLAGLIGLSLLSAPDSVGPKLKVRFATFLTGGAALFVLLPSATSGLMIIPFVGFIVSPLRRAIYALWGPILRATGPYFVPILLTAFLISLISWAWQQRRGHVQPVSSLPL